MTVLAVPPESDTVPELLRDGDVRFWGFADLGRMHAKASALTIDAREPGVSIIDDGVFVPRGHCNGRAWPDVPYVGGVIDANATPVPWAQVHRASGLFAGLPDAAAESVHAEGVLDEDIVYLGWLFDQYGHFLLESLARTWYLREIDPTMRVAFHVMSRPWPKGTAGRALELFGVPRDRIIPIAVPTRVRRLHVPQPLFEIGCGVHTRAAEAFQAVASRIVGDPDPIPSHQPVYLSRRLLHSSRRAIVGEGELEDILRENGFLIAHPETMTFEDQVRLFNRHSDYFACEGSAVHSTLFARQRPHIHLLAAGAVTPDHFLVSRVAGTTLSVVHCLSSPHRHPARRQTPELLDLGRISEYLAEHGFLRHRLRATLVPRVAHLDERYDEACLNAHITVATTGTQALPNDEFARALAVSKRSWRVCWRLMHYCVVHDPTRVKALTRRFIDLVADERDADLLAQHNREIGYRPDVKLSGILPLLGGKTRDHLRATLTERFPQ